MDITVIRVQIRSTPVAAKTAKVTDQPTIQTTMTVAPAMADMEAEADLEPELEAELEAELEPEAVAEAEVTDNPLTCQKTAANSFVVVMETAMATVMAMAGGATVATATMATTAIPGPPKEETEAGTTISVLIVQRHGIPAIDSKC